MKSMVYPSCNLIFLTVLRSGFASAELDCHLSVWNLGCAVPKLSLVEEGSHHDLRCFVRKISFCYESPCKNHEPVLCCASCRRSLLLVRVGPVERQAKAVKPVEQKSTGREQ